jgi:pyrimidine-nucleoside phosphorylase
LRLRPSHLLSQAAASLREMRSGERGNAESSIQHMHVVDVIVKKRDGKQLTRREISFLIKGYTTGDVADYQMAAMAMAICLRGMSAEETLWLTEEMLASGKVVDLSDLGGHPVDKHSTGGVGDKTSLVVAPVVAAAGVPVPMISGRALGHSGGTLDKLESIPGFRTNLSLLEFRKALQKVGAALIGQTDEIAPADKKLYALRDVTGTVECIPLMAASIMSKKLAEGITGLVFDIKVGSGAFLKNEADSSRLARLMIDIGRGMGKECVALITDMSQPLGRTVGNALEVKEAFDTLKGDGPSDFVEVCRDLSAEMLVLGRAAASVEGGRELFDRMIESGAALEKMRQIMIEQGADGSVLDHYNRLPSASGVRSVRPAVAGVVQSIDTEALGRASMVLGAGRDRLDTTIDYGVGLTIEAKVGDRVDAASALAILHFNHGGLADEAYTIVRNAYSVGPGAIRPGLLIKQRME